MKLEDIERDRFLAEAGTLATLISHHAWPGYEDLLAKMRLGALEEMAHCQPAELPFWQGVVQTLAQVLERPHDIVREATAVQTADAQDKRKFSEVARSLQLAGGDVRDEL